MKKTILLALFLLLAVQPAWALSPDGRTDMGPLARVGYVLMRGVGNAVGIPFEIPGTFVRESHMHPRLWPITGLPRLFTNAVVRVSSIANDIVFYPFIAPFTNDLSPHTEAFDLPEYPWQIE